MRNDHNKYLIFFSFFVYPLSPDFLCISYFSYPLWMFIVFMILRTTLLDVPMVISALCYWVMLRLRYYAFFNLPHYSIEQVLLPYMTGLILDRVLMFLIYYTFYDQIRLPLWWEMIAITLGAIVVVRKIRFNENSL